MSQHTDFAKSHMDKCIEALKANFARVRSGRANPHILDPIKVDYYGQPTPITQLAGVKVPEASMLVVEPWDKTALKAIAYDGIRYYSRWFDFLQKHGVELAVALRAVLGHRDGRGGEPGAE